MKRKIKLWLMLVMTLLISFVSVLSDLIKVNGNIDVFTPLYWYNLALTNVSAVVIIFLANSTEKDIQKGKNLRYTSLSKTLFDLFKDLNTLNMRTDFCAYIKADNEREKREVYFSKIHKKIKKCERKIENHESRYNTIRLFFRKPVIENPQTFFTLIWQSRLSRWQARLETAEKDVKYAKVRYIRVSEDSIFGMSDKKHRSSRDMSFHTAAHNIEILVKKILIVLIFGFAASISFLFEPVVFSISFFYNMATRLFQILMALYTGISDADKFVGGDMCDTLTRRINYVQGFKENHRMKKDES